MPMIVYILPGFPPARECQYHTIIIAPGTPPERWDFFFMLQSCSHGKDRARPFNPTMRGDFIAAVEGYQYFWQVRMHGPALLNFVRNPTYRPRCIGSYKLPTYNEARQIIFYIRYISSYIRKFMYFLRDYNLYILLHPKDSTHH